MPKKSRKTIPASETEGDAAAETATEEPQVTVSVGENRAVAELEAAREEAAANRDLYMRARAELENVVRRHERDRAELSQYAAEAVTRDLLATVDDLERAIEHATLVGDDENGILEGVEMVYKGLLATLEKHGVRRIDALGTTFDPSRHEAVAMVESVEQAPNTVVAEHRAGYTIGERLLRPAMVAVARAPAAADAESEQD